MMLKHLLARLAGMFRSSHRPATPVIEDKAEFLSRIRFPCC